MKSMIRLSLLINVAVLGAVCSGLLLGAQWTTFTYGADSPAQGILLAVYLAILLASLGLLFRPQVQLVAAVLGLQILYKVMTPFTVGTLLNPAVASNLAIAAFHGATLWLIWRSHRPGPQHLAGRSAPIERTLDTP
jgi:hypothetical protein